jgi:hypothetical protein
VGLKSLKSLNLTNGYPNKNKNKNNKVKSKPLELAGKKINNAITHICTPNRVPTTEKYRQN